MAFKARMAYNQQINPLLLNVQAAEDLLAELYKKKEEKEVELRLVMPKVPVYSVKTKPKVYKRDGSISSLGQNWLKFLAENNLPADNERPVKYIKSYDEPNPQSMNQIKTWLYELGWEPCTFRYEKNKETFERKKVPQVLSEDKTLTPSVAALLKKEPKLILLEGLGLINHRIGLVQGILEKAYDGNGWVSQTLKALTSTHRYRHKTIVNLPKIIKAYGSEIRSLFIAPQDKVVIGIDVKNLESRTRDHSIQPLDPDYVAEMSDPDFDSHLDIAIRSGLLTEEQAEAHKRGESNYSKERSVGKQVNFACVYNVGPETLSINTGFSRSKSEKLIEAYWERNWAVKTYANSLEVKTCLGKKWIKSELSGFWLELRKENDRFSAHNQNAGVFFFDTWTAYLDYFGIKINLQSHDEIVIYVSNCKVDETKEILKKACMMANKKLNLNVVIDIDIQVGNNYGDVH